MEWMDVFESNLVKTISKNISRKNKNITSTDDKILQEIGGKILIQTINNTYSSF